MLKQASDAVPNAFPLHTEGKGGRSRDVYLHKWSSQWLWTPSLSLGSVHRRKDSEKMLFLGLPQKKCKASIFLRKEISWVIDRLSF